MTDICPKCEPKSKVWKNMRLIGKVSGALFYQCGICKDVYIHFPKVESLHSKHTEE